MDVRPGRDPPNVIHFAKATLLTAATAHYECSLASSLKMGGGLKKQQFLAAAARLFTARCPDVGPSEQVLPALLALTKATGGK